VPRVRSRSLIPSSISSFFIKILCPTIAFALAFTGIAHTPRTGHDFPVFGVKVMKVLPSDMVGVSDPLGF
jgi:hypothetical protein